MQRLPALAPGSSARCARCGAELWRPREDSLNRTLALGVTAAILFVVANVVPMLGIRVIGRSTATTVMGGVEQLWAQGMMSVAALVFLTAVLAPALQITFMLAIALAARSETPRRWIAILLRHNRHTQTWSMIEVMLLGVLVVILSAAQVIFDPREVWTRIEWADARGGGAVPPEAPLTRS